MTRASFLLLATAAAARAAKAPTLAGFPLAGDGVTDDTDAIQQAVDAGAGELRFPKGRYRITRPIVIRLDRVGPVSISGGGVATIVMAGPGPAFHILGTHAGSAAPESVRPNVWERQRAPLVEAIEIAGAHPEAAGIRLEGTMQPTLSRLLIRRVRDGALLTGRNRNAIVADCHIYDNAGVGVLLDGVNLHQINITGSHISYNRAGGIVIRNSEVRNIQIGACDIEANQGKDTAPTANILFDARAGSVLEGAITGCTVQHGHEAPGSANIRFLGASARDVNKVGNFLITGNALSDVHTNIHLQYARGVVITANTFWKGHDHHLLVEGSSNILVGVNNFDRNPDYKAEASPDDVVFTDTVDSTLDGLHFNRAGRSGPALIFRRCRRIDLNNVRVLDGDARPLLVEATRDLRIAGGNLRLQASGR